jgi:anti-anti-sigma factor
MGQDLTTPTVGPDGPETGGTMSSIGDRVDRGASDRNIRRKAAWNVPGLTLRSLSVRTHTLILTGELTHRSTSALEQEIERLCADGVTGITLDLRQLTYIDPIGVAVIAFRCGLCERQGLGFMLIPGSRFIQRVFEQAGVLEDLPFQVDEVAARRLHA